MKAFDMVSGVLVLVVGVAIVAVIVSKGAQTSAVITNAGNAFAQIIGSAVGPVSGGTVFHA